MKEERRKKKEQRGLSPPPPACAAVATAASASALRATADKSAWRRPVGAGGRPLSSFFFLLSSLILLTGPADSEDRSGQEDDARELASRVAQPSAKLRLILIGRAAVSPLWSQIESHDLQIAVESRIALRWLMRLALPEETSALTECLLLHSEKSQPETERRFAVELLGDLGGKKAVETLVSLLDEPALRQAALDALVETPDDSTSALLAGLAKKASGDWRVSLIRALGMRRDPQVTPELIEWTRRDETRRTAVEALGLSDDSAAVEPLLEVAKGSYSDRPAVFSALTRIGEAHGDSAEAARIFSKVLSVADEEKQQIAALAALGRIADPSSHKIIEAWIQAGSPAVKIAAFGALFGIADSFYDRGDVEEASKFYWRILQDVFDEPGIVRALKGCARTKNTRALERIQVLLGESRKGLRAAAVESLREMPGPQPTQWLLSMLETAVRPLVLKTLGERRDAAAVAKIVPYAEKGEPAALQALGEIGDLRAAKVLEDAIAKYREGALAAYVRLGEVNREANPEEARRILRAAIGLNPDPALLLEIADNLPDPEDRAEAVKIYRRALPSGSRELALKLRGRGEDVEIPSREGMVDFWWLIGPFQGMDTGTWFRPEFPERGIELSKPHKISERATRWRGVSVQCVDLAAVFGVEDGAAYATCEILCAQTRDVTIRVGHENGLVVWLNGAVVHSVLGPRAWIDEDTFQARLRTGSNRVLVKIRRRGGGWRFRMGIDDEKGRPLEFKIK